MGVLRQPNGDDPSMPRLLIGAGWASSEGLSAAGALMVYRLSGNGSVAVASRIDTSGFGLDENDLFGASVEGGVGDVDGDGVNDVLVGATGAVTQDDLESGEVFLLLMLGNDTVREHARLLEASGVPILGNSFGNALAVLPPLFPGGPVRLVISSSEEEELMVLRVGWGDGVAVVAPGISRIVVQDDVTGSSRFDDAVRFGRAISNVGDIDGNGHDDLVVGAP